MYILTDTVSLYNTSTRMNMNNMRKRRGNNSEAYRGQLPALLQYRCKHESHTIW